MLFLSARHLPLYFALTGINATAFLTLTGVIVPRLGIALFFAAVTLGSVSGALILDNAGAFGAVSRDMTLVRVMGVGLVGLGTIVVRWGK